MSLWLDHLPRDVLSTISSHLTKATTPLPLLPLLTATTHNHAALLHPLHPNLSLIDVPLQTLPHVLSVHSPTFLHVILQDRPEHLRLLPDLQVPNLTVVIQGYSTLHKTVHALATAKSSRHALSFPLPPCEWNHPLVKPSDLIPLETLPKLKELHFTCVGYSTFLEEIAFWRAITYISSLTNISIAAIRKNTTTAFTWSSTTSDCPFLPFLSTRASVSLQGTYSIAELASTVGRSVKKASDIDTVTTPDQLLNLCTSCPNLAYLHLKLPPSATGSVQEALQNLPNIRALVLHFTDDEVARFSPGTLLATVKNAPNLTELSLAQVHAPLAELEAILKHLGARLEVFDVSLDYYTESPLEACVALCESAVKYNHGLRSFLEHSEDLLKAFEQRDRVKMLAKQTLALLKRLGICAPLVSTDGIVRKVRALLAQCEGGWV